MNAAHDAGKTNADSSSDPRRVVLGMTTFAVGGLMAKLPLSPGEKFQDEKLRLPESQCAGAAGATGGRCSSR